MSPARWKRDSFRATAAPASPLRPRPRVSGVAETMPSGRCTRGRLAPWACLSTPGVGPVVQSRESLRSGDDFDVLSPARERLWQLELELLHLAVERPAAGGSTIDRDRDHAGSVTGEARQKDA